MEFPDDAGLRSVLESLGTRPDRLLGHGGEAWVYGLDEDRVVRVLRNEVNAQRMDQRRLLVEELATNGASFAVPEILEIGSAHGRSYAIERRLPGDSVLAGLRDLDRRQRNQLIEAHLDAAAALGDLHLEPRDWFGDLLTPSPVRTSRWRDYLEAKAADSLSRTPGFEAIDPSALANDLPDTADGSFVHLDGFAGNMMSIGPTITAVIDFGETCIRGDRRLDPLTAAIYFCTPAITPVADGEDRRVAQSWLRNAGLADWYEPARRWIAAYWAWAVDDRELHAWCRQVLLTETSN